MKIFKNNSLKQGLKSHRYDLVCRADMWKSFWIRLKVAEWIVRSSYDFQTRIWCWLHVSTSHILELPALIVLFALTKVKKLKFVIIEEIEIRDQQLKNEVLSFFRRKKFLKIWNFLNELAKTKITDMIWVWVKTLSR